MKELNYQVSYLIYLLCVFGVFSLPIILAFRLDDYFNTQTQIQILKTHIKNLETIECRIAYKDRDASYIDNVCGTIPQMGENK
jgi:hypothetical protein